MKEQYGQRYKVEVTKSKLSKPFREVWFTWNLETGQIDHVEFLIAQGIEQGLIVQSGNTWTYGTVRAVGREKFQKALRASETDVAELGDAIRVKHGLEPLSVKPRGTAKTSKVTKPATKKPAPKKMLRR